MTPHQIDPGAHRAITFTLLEQRRHVLVDAAVLADRLGYHTVLIPEGWGFDAGVVLAEIALKTTRIRIATGIASIWGRSPGTLAMMAATLDDLSGGRFTLGLGASTRALAEGFHGVAFDAPAARLDHTIEQVRSLLGGGRAAPAGSGRGLRLSLPARPDLPIWAAALGPRATSVAVRAADAWLPVMVPLDCVDTVRKAAGAGDGEPTVVAGPMVAPGTGGRRAAEQVVGWYLTGMGPFYGQFVASLGFDREVAALRAANPRPTPGAIEWPAAADALLDQLAAVGDQSTIESQLAAWDARADIVAVGVAPGDPDAVLAAVTAAAPPGRSDTEPARPQVGP